MHGERERHRAFTQRGAMGGGVTVASLEAGAPLRTVLRSRCGVPAEGQAGRRRVRGGTGSGPDPGTRPAVLRLGPSRTACLAPAACPLPDCFVLTSSPHGRAGPARPPPRPPLFLRAPNSPNSRSPGSMGDEVPGAGSPLPRLVKQPGADVGPPGQSLHGEADPRQETARDQGQEAEAVADESSLPGRFAKGPLSPQAQSAVLQDAAGAERGQGLPRDLRSRAI